MLTPDIIKTLAKQLYNARKTRTQLRHFSREYPEMTIEDGYAIQRAWVELELADGRVIKGRKIGLTSRAMQLSSQITEPDYAPLMDDMFFETGADIAIDRFIAPRVEVELAFILGSPLKGPGVTIFDVLSATDYVTPALEIIDARIEQFDRDTKAMRKVFDTISDFAANAGIVLGGRPVRPLDVDIPFYFGAITSQSRTVAAPELALVQALLEAATALPGVVQHDTADHNRLLQSLFGDRPDGGTLPTPERHPDAFAPG